MTFRNANPARRRRSLLVSGLALIGFATLSVAASPETKTQRRAFVETRRSGR
jgi:hypothetical protein